MSDLILAIDVPGIPVPQGSMKHIGRGRVIHSNGPALDEWREAIINRAKAQIEDKADSAVVVHADFRLLRPKTVRRLLPTKKFDLDKLARALCDALTMAGVWTDDGLVVELHATKTYATPDAPPGVAVRVTSY